ncbi:hypothetical protein [Syntrophorhabdus aromaticivorans]|uniref:hypothetical protein n=1 Tax=Syntrophorhabdus aromaticivorans TaxID=328301 RepID=UPI00041D6530|nr:hypothetical protein [Syntrophorhabdus aromaticivorans]
MSAYRGPSAVAASQLAELGLLDLGGAQTLPGTTEQQDLIDSLSWVSRIALNDAERPAITAAVAGAQALADLVKNKCGDHEPMFSVVTVANRTREGTAPRVSAFAETGEIFKNAPAEKGGYFKVAGILE